MIFKPYKVNVEYKFKSNSLQHVSLNSNRVVLQKNQQKPPSSPHKTGPHYIQTGH